MKTYIKKFENHDAYVAFTETEDFIKPNVSLCIQETEIHYNPYTYENDYLTFIARESGTFTFTPVNIINYSTDGGETWVQGNSVNVNSGDKVMWKGEMSLTSDGIGTFGSTANFDVQGNIMSLLYGDNFKGQIDLTGKYGIFKELFYQNTKVINAENLSLPATTLADYCYQGMFGKCTNLTAAPQLLATTLASGCYQSIFQDCSSLVNAPELPATTLAIYCYAYMFNGCTSLTTAPILPTTVLAEHCYHGMFSGCTSLTTAPALPATTLVNSCYSHMFFNCTSLTTAPELPATILTSYCYYNMFTNCTSLTTAPVLPATTLVDKCYDGMFKGCINLNYIKAMFTTIPSISYTNDWVKDVSATGTFVKNSAAEWEVTGVNSIPSGWTIETASE